MSVRTSVPIEFEEFPQWHPLRGTVKVWIQEYPELYFAFGDSITAATVELLKRYPKFRVRPDDNPANYICGL